MRSIDKINALLDKKGMSGSELSLAAGLSNSVYSQWNTGKTKPSRKALFNVARVLDVDVSEILPDLEPDMNLPICKESEEAKKARPLVGDGLDEKLRLLSRSPGLLEKLDRFVALAAKDPETAERFLAFAVQELESLRRDH